MRLAERISPVLKISLLLCLVLLLNLSPVSNTVEGGLRKARVAREESYARAEADGLRQAVQHEPWRTDLWEAIGRAEYAAGENDRGLEALQTALSIGVLSIDGRYLMGEILLETGDKAGAEAAWLAVIGYQCADGSTPVETDLLKKTYERLAVLRSSLGDYDGAVRILRDWHTSKASTARAAFLLGLHLSITTPEQAEPLLIEAARAEPAYGEVVQSLRGGLALYNTTDQPAYGWLMIGRSLGSVGQWALAEHAFRRSVEQSPEYAEAWAFLSEARTQNGGSGQPEMERAIALAPKSAVVNALNALALRRQARYTEALEFLRSVSLQEPDEPFWLVEIANTQVEQGDLMGALSSYEQAAALNPKNPVYWQALAMFSADYNVDVRGVGLPAARQAVMLAPDGPAALDVMGWTLANLDDSATGERFLQQALDADPAFAPANLHLAQIYLRRQQPGEAYDYLKRAVNQASGSSTTYKAAADTARRLLQQYFGEDG